MTREDKEILKVLNQLINHVAICRSEEVQIDFNDQAG